MLHGTDSVVKHVFTINAALCEKITLRFHCTVDSTVFIATECAFLLQQPGYLTCLTIRNNDSNKNHAYLHENNATPVKINTNEPETNAS